MTPSGAKKANTSLAGDNKAYSNGRSRENECGNGEGAGTKNGSGLQKRLLYHRSR